MYVENYYTLLGVPRKATSAEIKKAYQEKLKSWNPDKSSHKNNQRPAALSKKALQATQVLDEAYYILSDKKRRKNYDEVLHYTEHEALEQKIDDQIFWDKLGKAAPALKNIVDSVKDLFYLFKDAVQGKYKVHPVTLGLVGGGLLYLIIPADMIPDILPFLGFIDDLTVLSTIMATIQAELAAYRDWRVKKGD